MSKEKYTNKTVANREEIESSLKEFSLHWSSQITVWRRDGSGRSAERKYAHQFWLDLLSCFGYKGERLDLFEVDASRLSTKRPGRIDVFLPGVFIGEIKSLHIPLGKADDQIIDYLGGGSIHGKKFPAGAIATNFSEFHVWWPKSLRVDIRFPLRDISKHFDALSFLLPDILENIEIAEIEKRRLEKENARRNQRARSAKKSHTLDHEVEIKPTKDPGRVDQSTSEALQYLRNESSTNLSGSSASVEGVLTQGNGAQSTPTDTVDSTSESDNEFILTPGCVGFAGCTFVIFIVAASILFLWSAF